MQGLHEVITAARAGKLEERIVSRGVLRVTPQRGTDVRCGMFVAAGMCAQLHQSGEALLVCGGHLRVRVSRYCWG